MKQPVFPLPLVFVPCGWRCGELERMLEHANCVHTVSQQPPRHIERERESYHAAYRLNIGICHARETRRSQSCLHAHTQCNREIVKQSQLFLPLLLLSLYVCVCVCVKESNLRRGHHWRILFFRVRSVFLPRTRQCTCALRMMVRCGKG